MYLNTAELKNTLAKFSPVWMIVLAYQVITLALIVWFDISYIESFQFFVPRLVLAIFLIIRLFLDTPFMGRYGVLMDALVVYILMGSFYSETALLNTYLFPKLDPVLSNWDLLIFGFQPSIVFSEMCDGTFFSEVMFMGYFSYYLMPLFAFLVVWTRNQQFFEKLSFMILSSFFIYYLIFVLLPAAGPQYFFETPLNQIEAKGVFGAMVKFIQKMGEAPTAAFPSSHVGIAVIILILVFRQHKRVFFVFLPFVGLLLFSTIYIKAHYFVDLVAGLLSAPLVFCLSHYLYQKLNVLFKPDFS